MTDINTAGAIGVSLELSAAKDQSKLQTADNNSATNATHLTNCLLWMSHTAMLPSAQHEKQSLLSGLIASA